MDLDRGQPFFTPNNPASGNQLQSDLGVELSRPVDGDFHAFSHQQVPIGGKQDPVAAHVECLADTHVVGAFTVENLKADFPFNGEPVRAAAIVFVFFQSHNLLQSVLSFTWPCLHTQIAVGAGVQQ
jgi:hypothetical protein